MTTLPVAAAGGSAAQLLPTWAMREFVLRLQVTELLSVSDAPMPTTPELFDITEQGLAADVDALRAGTSIRGLLMPQACASEYDRNYYGTLDTIGGEHRVLRTPAQRFLLFDRSLAVVESGVDHHVLLIRAPGALAAIHTAFEGLWAQSLARRPSRIPGDDDDRLLDLLAQGRTDAAAARALGVSERTFRRRVMALMDAYGARSRYELGLKIAASPSPAG